MSVKSVQFTVAAHIMAALYRASAAPPTFAIHSYPVEKRCPISCNIKGCLSSVLKKAQDSFENSLDGITLADVVGEIRRATQ